MLTFAASIREDSPSPYFTKHQKLIKMINEKAGVIAGKIWNALNEQGTLTGKDLKKAAG